MLGLPFKYGTGKPDESIEEGEKLLNAHGDFTLSKFSRAC